MPVDAFINARRDNGIAVAAGFLLFTPHYLGTLKRDRLAQVFSACARILERFWPVIDLTAGGRFRRSWRAAKPNKVGLTEKCAEIVRANP